MSNGHDTVTTKMDLGMASATVTEPAAAKKAGRGKDKITRQRQWVPIEKAEMVIRRLLALPAFHKYLKVKTPERYLMEEAGMGGTSWATYKQSGRIALYAYNALFGLLAQHGGVAGAVTAPPEERKAADFDEASLLFDATRVAIKAMPSRADNYKKLMAHFATEMVRHAS